MKSKKVLILVVLCFFAIFSMACFITDLVANVTGDSNDAIVNNNASMSEDGGFEYVVPADYTEESAYGIVSLVAPDGNSDTGPAIILFGGIAEEDLTNEEFLTKMQSDMGEADFSTPKNIKIDGITGLSTNVSTTDEGVEVEGRLVVVMVSPTQQFIMVGIAPKGEWKSINKVFEKVMKSIHFFEPVPIDYSDYSFTESPVVGVTEEPVQVLTAFAPTEAVSTEVSSDGYLHQWAISAEASSQYTETNWSAMQAVGAPDVPECGDSTEAWASATAVGEEWIELTFETPVIPYVLTIVESYNPSQVVSVIGIAEDGTEYLIWEGEPVMMDTCPYEMIIDISPEGDPYIYKIRITVDHSFLNLGWDEIDAVELVGIP